MRQTLSTLFVLSIPLAAACSPGPEIHPTTTSEDESLEDGDDEDSDDEDVGAVEYTLEDPWTPADREDVLDMAAFTAPHAQTYAWQSQLLDAVQALVASGEACPVEESVGADGTRWVGDCSAPGFGATVAGTLSLGPEEDASGWTELRGAGFLLSLSSGETLGLDGALGYDDATGGDLRVEGTWTVLGLGEDDIVVTMDLYSVVGERGGEGAGYLWLAERASGSTGDLSFSWTSEGPSVDCPEEEELELTLSGAVEVRVRGGGDTPCDGELEITVDGEPW